MIIRGKRKRCEGCQETFERRNVSKKRRTENEERHLLHCPEKRLSAEEKSKKTLLLAGRHRNRISALKKRTRKAVKKAERELAKYKPANEEHQAAVRNVANFLNLESEKQSNRNCYWLDDDGEGQCVFVGESSKELLTHLNDVHLRPQVTRNQSSPPIDRKYYCRWNDCHRKAPYQKREQLYRHLNEHVPSAKGKQRLGLLNDQLINLGRSSTGRRYSAKTKAMAMEKYRSRGSWKLTRSMSTLPLPSVGTMTNEKNRGDVATPGIDHHVVKQLGELIQQQPRLKHGILAFDEVSYFFFSHSPLHLFFYFRFISMARSISIRATIALDSPKMEM